MPDEAGAVSLSDMSRYGSAGSVSDDVCNPFDAATVDKRIG